MLGHTLCLCDLKASIHNSVLCRLTNPDRMFVCVRGEAWHLWAVNEDCCNWIIPYECSYGWLGIIRAEQHGQINL